MGYGGGGAEATGWRRADAPCGRVGEHDEMDRGGLGSSHPYGPCQTKEEEELVVMIAKRKRRCNDKKKSEIYGLSP